MKISDKRARDLYKAISDPITDLRIEVCQGPTLEEIDEKLFILQSEIWRNVHGALKLKLGLF